MHMNVLKGYMLYGIMDNLNLDYIYIHIDTYECCTYLRSFTFFYYHTKLNLIIIFINYFVTNK